MKLGYFNADTMSQKWLIFFSRGLLTISFAIILLVHQKLELEIVMLIFFFGTYILMDGLIAIVAGILSQKINFIIFGFIASIIGGYAFYPQNKSSFFFLALISAWFLLRGIFETSAAIGHSDKIFNRWELMFSGGLSALFCLLSMLLHPSYLLTIFWVFITYLFVIGVVWIFYAFKLRAVDQQFFLRRRVTYQSEIIIETTLI